MHEASSQVRFIRTCYTYVFDKGCANQFVNALIIFVACPGGLPGTCLPSVIAHLKTLKTCIMCWAPLIHFLGAISFKLKLAAACAPAGCTSLLPSGLTTRPDARACHMYKQFSPHSMHVCVGQLTACFLKESKYAIVCITRRAGTCKHIGQNVLWQGCAGHQGRT